MVDAAGVSKLLQERVLAYLHEHNVLALATNGPEGLWSAAVFYANDGFRLYFLSGPDTRHARNVNASPLVAATIQEDYRTWQDIRGIQLEGEVVALCGDAERRARSCYGAKFPFVAEAGKAPAAVSDALEQVVWYELIPSRMYFVDNTVAFGHRDEVPLD